MENNALHRVKSSHRENVLDQMEQNPHKHSQHRIYINSSDEVPCAKVVQTHFLYTDAL